MKIALISHEGGGISSVTFGLAQSLAKKGNYTAIFSGAFCDSPQKIKLNDHLELNYLPIINLPPRHYWFQAINFTLLLKVLKDYDVIHGMSVNASFLLSFFKGRLGKPFVATIHEDMRESRRVFANQPISSWTLKEMGFFFLEFPLFDIPTGRILNSSDHVTFCSHSLFNQVKAYRKNYTAKVSVIQNGLDFSEISSVKDEALANEDAVSIVFAGRLMRVKGVMFLLEAIKQLGKDFKNVTVKIFGKGPLSGEVEKTILRFGLSNRVRYEGQVSHRRLIGEIKKSSFVVFPSLNEAQPMFVLEAMGCKKPVVAFDLPFAREVVTPMKTGLLSKPGDIGDLSKNIEILANDVSFRLKLGEAGYNYVRKKHDWDTQAEKYLDVYEGVLKARV